MPPRPNGGFWSPAGNLVIALASRGLVPYCVSCGAERPRARTPYCRSRACSDLFYERFYRSLAVGRRAALRRAQGKCERCGCTPVPLLDVKGHPWRTWGRLEVDHVVEVARGGDLWDPRNLQVLCSRCHWQKTRRFMRLGKIARHRPQPNQRPLEAFATSRVTRSEPFGQPRPAGRT